MRDLRDDLLREHVERLRRHRDPVELPPAGGVEERRAVAEIVARERKEPALRYPADGVARASHALQERRDRARRAELADEIDVADVDPELERRGRDQDLQLPALQPLLGVEPDLAGEAAVMRGDLVRAEPLGEMARRALGEPPGVDEHERRAVLVRERREAVVHLLPRVARHHRLERRRRQLEREVAVLDVPGVDDRAGRTAGQEAPDLLDRLLRGGEPDAHQPRSGQRLEPLERQREVRAALVRRERVDLVDDDRARRPQHLAARLAGQQDVERLGRGDDDVRRALAHARALGLRRVAGANERADLDVGQAERLQFGADAGERRLQVALDVVRQRLERRDVDDVRLVREAPRGAFAHQRVDRGEERRERLARAGGRGDQCMAAGHDRRPRRDLRRGRPGERRAEPRLNRWMEELENSIGHCCCFVVPAAAGIRDAGPGSDVNSRPSRPARTRCNP